MKYIFEEQSLTSHLIAYIPVLKRNQFRFEKEYRMVMPGIIDHGGRRHPYEILESELADFDGHKEYHFLHNFKPEELREIVLGYSIEDKFEEQISNWLEDNGYNLNEILISKSSIMAE